MNSSRDLEQLTPEERAQFRAWYEAWDAAEWDRQLEADIAAGKLDRVVAERLQLLEDLWDSIAVDTPDAELPMSAQLVAKLERRMTNLDEGSERTFSWEEVRDRILKDKLHGP